MNIQPASATTWISLLRQCWIVRLILLAALFVIIFSALPRVARASLTITDKSEQMNALGCEDFIAYWSAYHAALEGLNPYDSNVLARFQSGSCFNQREIQRFWNPPWLLILMAPVLTLPLQAATTVWLMLNCLFIPAIALLSWRTFINRPPDLKIITAASILCAPVYDVILTGQLSLAIVLVFLCLLRGLLFQRPFPVAIALALISVKPQALYLVLAFIVFYLVRRKDWAPLLIASALIGILALATQLIFPVPMAGWDPIASAPIEWRTPNVATLIRIVLHFFTGNYSQWPIIVVPGLTLLWMAVSYEHTQLREPATAVRRVLYLLPISLLSAPYVWWFDYSILLIPQLVLLGSIKYADNRAAVRSMWIWIIALFIASFTQRVVIARYDFFVWYPLAFFIWEKVSRSRNQSVIN